MSEGISMKQRRTYLIVVLAMAVLPLVLSGCGGSSSSSEAEPASVVEQIEGTESYRITLSEHAAARLAIKTAAVEQGAGATVVPYGAVFYSPDGETWAYVNTAPLTFVRQPIVVDRIEGDRAILSKGPAVGTKVATVGVIELFGAESGIDQ
jgi:hypothetical protein